MGRIWSVQELTIYIKKLITGDKQMTGIWVRGELSNCKLHHTGHIYLTLKDDNASVKGVMFRSRAQYLRFRPENGMSVLIRGYIDVYERDGAYQLYIEEMQPDGLGALYMAFEQLKKRLEKAGLFAEERKRLIPSFPRKICVVAALGSAALRDIMSIIERRYSTVHIVIIPSSVQGENAPDQLVWALQAANKVKDAEVIIVARGGGSMEDLWAFNTEKVALAIARSELPVISAVGHETDFTIADYVADLRAATPSAAAELVLPRKADLRIQLRQFNDRLLNSVRSQIKRKQQELQILQQKRIFSDPKRELIDRRQQEKEWLMDKLERSAESKLNGCKQNFIFLSSRLQSLSPLATLERGYGICQKNDGNVVTAASQTSEGDLISVRLKDGKIKCTVNAVEMDR